MNSWGSSRSRSKVSLKRTSPSRFNWKVSIRKCLTHLRKSFRSAITWERRFPDLSSFPPLFNWSRKRTKSWRERFTKWSAFWRRMDFRVHFGVISPAIWTSRACFRTKCGKESRWSSGRPSWSPWRNRRRWKIKNFRRSAMRWHQLCNRRSIMKTRLCKFKSNVKVRSKS